MKDERTQLNEMTDHELASYWNILQFPCLRVGTQATNKHDNHVTIVDSLLNERGIPHEVGKRTILVDRLTDTK